MSNYGLAIIILGLIGMAGAIDTGYGWYTSSVLLIIGVTLLLIKGKERLNEKKNFRNLVKRIASIELDERCKGRRIHAMHK